MPTRAQLVGFINDSYATFKQTIASVPEGELTKPGTVGEWSARDVIAHVGADELWMAGQLEALRTEILPNAAMCYGIETPPPDGIDLSTQDGRNAWQRERLRELSLDDVRAMATEAHARLLAIIATFDDVRLAAPLAIGPLGTVGHIREPQAGEAAWPLWEWLRGVTYKHYDEHAADVRAAVASG
jgi:hypothetical protein